MKNKSQQQHLLLVFLGVAILGGRRVVHDLSRQVQIGVAVKEEGGVPAVILAITSHFHETFSFNCGKAFRYGA